MKIIYALLICCTILPCKAQQSSLQSIPARDTMADEVIIVPVVIHLLYNDNTQNISDAQVLSQIESLNKDYSKLNNTSNIPAAFAPLAADVKIQFCIARIDPEGKPTTGIIRKYTTIANWLANDEMKFSASGGDNAWGSKKYLNIWVCNLFGRSLGYSSVPGSPADKDGVVIQYNMFGTTGNLRAPFDKGRTATHEIGHWLGLLHLWGDALCGDDKVDDTPPQRTYNNGCPNFPHISACSINDNGDMFMNFMDFTDDACMSMFTNGQKKRMRSQFALGNARNSFLNSSVCNSPSPEAAPSAPEIIAMNKPANTANTSITVSLFPNPAKDFINIKADNKTDLIGKTVTIYNVLGTEVKRQLLASAKSTIAINDLPTGIYMVKIGEGKEVKMLQLVKK